VKLAPGLRYHPYATVTHIRVTNLVKISWNSPGIDGNMHTVRVEMARYVFGMRI
jgi:hypothetical protein